MNRSSTGLAVVAGAVLLLAGCSDSDGSPEGITVSGAYIPQPVSADMAAGFLTISNSGSSKDELTSVTSTAAPGGRISMVIPPPRGSAPDRNSVAAPRRSR